MRPLAAVALAGLVAGCGGAGAGSGPAGGPAVLAVRVATAQPSGASATAFALGRGRLATVAHVLDGGRLLSAGGRRSRVLHVDRRLDVAVLRAGAAGAPAPAIAAARAGEAVTVRVIRPGGARSLPARVTRTITARVHGPGGLRVRPALELAADVMPGDSGAPVLDGRRRVVGMIFAQASDDDAVAYALDARALEPSR